MDMVIAVVTGDGRLLGLHRDWASVRRCYGDRWTPAEGPRFPLGPGGELLSVAPVRWEYGSLGRMVARWEVVQ